MIAEMLHIEKFASTNEVTSVSLLLFHCLVDLNSQIKISMQHFQGTLLAVGTICIVLCCCVKHAAPSPQSIDTDTDPVLSCDIEEDDDSLDDSVSEQFNLRVLD